MDTDVLFCLIGLVFVAVGISSVPRQRERIIIVMEPPDDERGHTSVMAVLFIFLVVLGLAVLGSQTVQWR